jgi:hypothetical protein
MFYYSLVTLSYTNITLFVKPQKVKYLGLLRRTLCQTSIMKIIL